ncbi:MAG: alpha/beta fold hydrolase [Gammaproteobacteria bacterium]|nr:alpha/beta fold hydrolase [Gammaproteobacteria bacterium]
MPLLRRRVHAATLRPISALVVGSWLTLCALFFAASSATTRAESTRTESKDSAQSVVRRAALIVHDLDASRRFYQDILGFEVWLENNGKVTADSLPSEAPLGANSRFLIMKGKHPWIGMVGLLEYGASRPLPKTPQRLRPGDAILMIETDDVYAVYRRMQAAGTPILKPPKTQEVTGAGGVRWDATFLFAWDPDGHLLEVNQRGPVRKSEPAEPSPAAAAGAPGARAVASAEVMLRREFFDGRHGQLHLRRAMPRQTTGLVPPVVLLHQTPLSGRMFSELLPELGRSRLVLAPDTPGYGESAGPAAPPSVADYADALHDLIADQKEPVDLVGYHTGALLAAEIAVRHPESVRRLVLISMPFFDTERRASLRTVTPLAEDGSALLAEWKSTMSVRPLGQSLEQAARLVAEKQRAGTRASYAMAALASYDAAPMLRSIRVPTILIAPKDGLAANTAAAAALIPGSKLIDMPQWSYGFFDADPAGTARVILEALDKPSGDQPGL